MRSVSAGAPTESRYPIAGGRSLTRREELRMLEEEERIIIDRLNGISNRIESLDEITKKEVR